MIKVLHVINSLAVAGAELMMVRLVEAMDRERFEHTVVSLLDVDGLAPRLRSAGIRCETVGMRGGASVASGLPRLIKLMREVRPDVVQTWMYHSNLLGLLANRCAGNAPLSWSIHASELDPSTCSSALKVSIRLGARLSSVPRATVFNSYAAAKWHQRIGYRFRHWKFIPNGIAVDSYRPDAFARERFRNEIGLRPDAVLIGTVGRYDPLKDYPTFLRAFAQLHVVEPKAHAVMVGDELDADNRELMQLASTLGVAGKVHMLGARADIHSILPGFDVFVLASSSEACPTALIEAMACGVLCVATDVGDAARIIAGTGKVAPPRDPAALCVACIEVLAKRSDFPGAAARQRILDSYSLGSMTKGFADLFEDLVERRAGLAHPHSTFSIANQAGDTTVTSEPRELR